MALPVSPIRSKPSVIETNPLETIRLKPSVIFSDPLLKPIRLKRSAIKTDPLLKPSAVVGEPGVATGITDFPLARGVGSIDRFFLVLPGAYRTEIQYF